MKFRIIKHNNRFRAQSRGLLGWENIKVKRSLQWGQYTISHYCLADAAQVLYDYALMISPNIEVIKSFDNPTEVKEYYRNAKR